MDWLTLTGAALLAGAAAAAIVGFEWLRARSEQRARIDRLLRRALRR
jgi:hypothetical protein